MTEGKKANASVTQDQIGKHRIIVPVTLTTGEEVSKSRPRQQSRPRQPEDDILRRLRPPDRRSRQIPADGLGNATLIAQRLNRVCSLKHEMLAVGRYRKNTCVTS